MINSAFHASRSPPKGFPHCLRSRLTGKGSHPRPSHIVFILADDLGYGDLGCYGQTQIRSPNLDKFAAESLKFTQAYAGSPVCAPSRCALMSGRIAPGTTPQVTAFWNMLPTLCDIAGVPPSPGIDGVSIGRTLLKSTAVPHPPLYWEFHESGFKQALRDGDWKAIRNAPGPPAELFNLAADPGEKNNLAASEPALVSNFDTLLNRSRTISNAFPVRYTAVKDKP